VGAETNTSTNSAEQAYEAYLATQNRSNNLIDDSLVSSDESECDEELERSNVYMQKQLNANGNGNGSDDEVWNARLGAMSALNTGVSQLSMAVKAVRTTPVKFVAGPFSTQHRGDIENKENVAPTGPKTPSSLGTSGSDEPASIVVPSTNVPKPSATPLHPFADHRGRITERIFHF
jgi:hypothetical protein